MSLSRFDVVSVTCPDKKVTPGTTFTVGEFANIVGGFIQQATKISHQGWSRDGIECCVLQPGSEKWVKGKVKISLEFIPDEIEEEQPPSTQVDQ